MVFFHNINIGARVQVRWRGEVENGVIRFAGNMVTKDGEWVGLELDNRVGNTSGLYKGIQYFRCKDGHGIFTHARNIRFVPTKKLLHDTYRPLSRMTSSVDDTLFAKTEGVPGKSYTDPTVISQQYLKGIETLLKGKEDAWSEVARTSFHKSHLVGGRFPLPNMTEEHVPVRKLYRWNDQHFISPSSIPPIHVPRPILKRMISSEYFGTSIPRYCSLS